METKIEEAKDLKRQFEDNKISVQKCLGKQKLEDGSFVINPKNDKHCFGFSINKHHSSAPIYLNAYHGYCDDSNVSIFNNKFYIHCMVEAINKFLPQLREGMEKIMERKCNEVLLDAKGEAEEILKMIKDLGLD